MYELTIRLQLEMKTSCADLDIFTKNYSTVFPLSAAVPPMLAAAPGSMQSQIQALAKKCSATGHRSRVRVLLQMSEIMCCQAFSAASVWDGMTLTLLSWSPNKINSSSPVDCVLWEKGMERKVCVLQGVCLHFLQQGGWAGSQLCFVSSRGNKSQDF